MSGYVSLTPGLTNGVIPTPTGNTSSTCGSKHLHSISPRLMFNSVPDRLCRRSRPPPSAPPCSLFQLRFARSEEHTSELQSLMRISSAVFCLQKNKADTTIPTNMLYH